jgi:hypothetical protein
MTKTNPPPDPPETPTTADSEPLGEAAPRPAPEESRKEWRQLELFPELIEQEQGRIR